MLRDIAEVDAPTEQYSEAVRQCLAARFSGAGEALIEHAVALEAFLDVCTVAGDAVGASKPRDRLCQHALEALGEMVSRDGIGACEHHLKIIKDKADIPDVSALRRLLGTFNWVKGHFPNEVQAPFVATVRPASSGSDLPTGPRAGERQEGDSAGV